MKVQGRSRRTQIATLTAAVALTLGAAAPAHAVGFDKDGWNATFDGVLSAFYVDTKNDSASGNGASESRFMSGFNPSKFNAHFTAPNYNGLKVSGNFQFAANVSGNSGAGASAGGPNNDTNGFFGTDVRVLDINVSGDWGTIAMGRSWSIFSGSSIVYDEASGSGVGHLCGAAGNTFGGSCGRIGAGYTWTAFAGRVEYDTPDMGGFSARIGLFDPAQNSGTAFQTKAPRFEAEGSFAGKFDGGSYKLWVGALSQSLGAPAGGGSTSASSKLSGTDIGAHVDVGGFGLTGAYTDTKGFGVGGFKFGGITCKATECAEVKAKQAYLDASYKVSNTRFGASTGTSKQDANAAFSIAELKNTLNMFYVHHDLTPQARLTLEFDQFKQQNATTGATASKYGLWTVGLLYNF